MLLKHSGDSCQDKRNISSNFLSNSLAADTDILSYCVQNVRIKETHPAGLAADEMVGS